MCLKNYKGLLRGALALAVSLITVKVKTTYLHQEVRSAVVTYLSDNGLPLDFSQPPNRGVITKIMWCAEDVVFRDKSMDDAIDRLSRGLKINLTQV